MKLEEFFQAEGLTLPMIEFKEDESSYWENAIKFLRENWEKDVETMSEKQYNWAEKLREDLTEQRIEGRL